MTSYFFITNVKKNKQTQGGSEMTSVLFDIISSEKDKKIFLEFISRLCYSIYTQTMVLIICKVSILISFVFGAGRIGSNSQSDDKQTDKLSLKK